MEINGLKLMNCPKCNCDEIKMVTKFHPKYDKEYDDYSTSLTCLMCTHAIITPKCSNKTLAEDKAITMWNEQEEIRWRIRLISKTPIPWSDKFEEYPTHALFVTAKTEEDAILQAKRIVCSYPQHWFTRRYNKLDGEKQCSGTYIMIPDMQLIRVHCIEKMEKIKHVI